MQRVRGRPRARGVLSNLPPETDKTNYAWYSPNDSLASKQDKADRRREQLLDMFSDKDLQPDEMEGRVSEWIALLRDRDMMLRLKVDQENQKARENFIRELDLLLHHLPSFTPSSPDQQLLQSLLHFKSQLGQYCTTTQLASPPRRCFSVPTLSSFSYPLPPQPSSSPKTTPPEPPPPLPPDVPVEFLLYQDNETGGAVRPSCLQFIPPNPTHPQSKHPSSSSCQGGSNLSTCKQVPTSGNYNKGDDETDCPLSQPPISQTRPSHIGSLGQQSSLLEEITHKKEKLKHTNMAHTPGGTPVRTKHRLSSSSQAHGDILQRALKRKFKNVRVHSTPKGHGRSNMSNRGAKGNWSTLESGSVECSDIWSECGEAGYASDPDISLSSCSDLQTSSPMSAGDLVMDTTTYASSPGVSLQDEVEEVVD